MQVNDNRHSVAKADIECAQVVAMSQQKRKSLSNADTEALLLRKLLRNYSLGL
jgi:hypothetical protein